MRWVEFVKHLTMFDEMVHFEQNITIKCSKFSCFYILLLIYFSSFLIIISLFLYIIIIIEEKEKKSKKIRRIVWLSFLIKMIEFVNHTLLPHRCIVPRALNTAPQALIIVFCAEFLEFCAEFIAHCTSTTGFSAAG